MPKNFSRVFSAELEGINARLVEVETDLHVGLHAFTIVGLADKALSEAKERVSAALKNSGVKPPNKENKKIVVNLAPADVRKTGSQYDLAIAIGYLLATGQIKYFSPTKTIFIGELSLDGSLRPISGVLSIAQLAKKIGYQTLILPEANASEAAIVAGLEIIPIRNLNQLFDHLEDRLPITPQPITTVQASAPIGTIIDISEIKGQANAKRALMIAAAGGHNLLMVGSPGGGKTMLAQALNGLLPDITLEEAIEITQIYSATGQLRSQAYIGHRPFRSPHQSASVAAVLGGGTNPQPGEISLAHRGVLFLDEVPEFRRDLLESLRQPLEAGEIVVARAKHSLIFPAKFTLVAAMNPCPCGYYGDEEKECRCTMHEVQRYQKKLSGPLRDRIDLQIAIPRVSLQTLSVNNVEERESDILKKQIMAARKLQQERYGANQTNASLTAKQCDKLIKLDNSAKNFIEQVVQKSLLSARGYYRLLKTAQTIADLETAPAVTGDHLAEAFSYRLRE